MQELLERPKKMAQQLPVNDDATSAALWIIDALARELAVDGTLDRSALVAALQCRAGYEQADAVWPDSTEARRAELVARLAGRLARG